MDRDMTLNADSTWFADSHSRSTFRVAMIRSAGTATGEISSDGAKLWTEFLDFDRLEPFVAEAREHLPVVVAATEHESTAWTGRLWSQSEGQIVRAQEYFCAVPNADVVSLRIFDVAFRDSLGLIKFLEDLYYEKLVMTPSGVETPNNVQEAWRQGVVRSQPYHQLVLLPETSDEPDFDQIQRIIYRADLPARQEFSSLVRPDELNRRPNRGATLGSFVSVLWGQQEYVENCALLSAVQLVGVASRLSEARSDAWRDLDAVRDLANRRSGKSSYADRGQLAKVRAQLGRMQEQIVGHELNLAFGVEGVRSLMPLIPSLRIESYHRSLYRAMDFDDQARTMSSMLDRLRRAVESETSAIHGLEHALDSLRTRRWGLTVGFVTLVLAPMTLILGFFGASAREVDPEASMFDWSRYWPLYLCVVVGIGMTVVVQTLYSRLERRRLSSQV